MKNALYTAKIGYNEYWAEYSYLKLKKYCEKYNLDFRCFNEHKNIEYIASKLHGNKAKSGVYSSIYAIYDFLNSDSERMVWIDIDCVFIKDIDIFQLLPSLYLEGGFPTGKIYEKDCADQKYKLEKLKLVNLLINVDYTISIQTGFFSMDRANAFKFIKYIENFVDFNHTKSIDNYIKLLNNNNFFPNEEPLFEAFVVENNITPKRVIKTIYTSQIDGSDNILKYDLAHFCTKEGRKILENIIQNDRLASKYFI